MTSRQIGGKELEHDLEQDLLPVFLVGTAPYVVAAYPGTPYKTFADVIAASKAKPGSVKYASVGIGTLGHLAMTVLGNKAGVDITHVAYRGGGPAMNDVLGGHVDMIAGSAALITPHVETGKLRPVLQLGRERLPSLKDTQTAIEAGFPDFEALAWWGVLGPAGLLKPVLAKINAELAKVLNTPEVKSQLGDQLGVVERIGLKTTRVRSLWGEQITVSNDNLLNALVVVALHALGLGLEFLDFLAQILNAVVDVEPQPRVQIPANALVVFVCPELDSPVFLLGHP